VIDWVHL